MAKIHDDVLSLLKSEGIFLNDKKKAIQSLSECVASKKCIKAYLEILENENNK